MSQQPSAIDKVIHHWPVRARVPVRDILAKFNPNAYFDIQNIVDYCDARFTPGETLPMGCMVPPCELLVAYWRSKMKGGGVAYHMALVSSVRLPDAAGWIVTIGTYQKESRGRDETLFAGGVMFVLTPDGLMPITNEPHPRMVEGSFHFYGFEDYVMPSPSVRLIESWWDALAEASCPPAPKSNTDEAMKLLRRLAQGKGWRDDTRADSMYIMQAMLFANCRNVVRRKRGPTNLPPPWRKQGHPIIRYEMLAIGGKLTPRSDGDATPTGKKMSLHFVRGHFARYTADKPLFGRHVGQFWIPQHTRGDSAIGTVNKDYAVRA